MLCLFIKHDVIPPNLTALSFSEAIRNTIKLIGQLVCGDFKSTSDRVSHCQETTLPLKQETTGTSRKQQIINLSRLQPQQPVSESLHFLTNS